MNEWPTMTLHELAEALRANRIRASERKLGQMILEGRFPFAIGTDGVYIIFRAAFYDWLENMMKTKPIRI